MEYTTCLKGKKAIRRTWIASGSTVVVMPRNFAISAKSAKNTQMYQIKQTKESTFTQQFPTIAPDLT